MYKRVVWFFTLSLLTVSYLVIFRNLFSNFPIAWGDGPYFYPENLKELFSKPFVWDIRNSNFGSDQSSIIWLYIPTFIIGLVFNIFNIGSEYSIKFLFYFLPAVLSIIGAYFFIDKYIKDKWPKLLGVILYSLNSYVLLLFDGGQLGVVLAYSLFPFVSLAFINLIESVSFKNSLFLFLSILIISNVDLRVTILAIVFPLLLKLTETIFSNKDILYSFWNQKRSVDKGFKILGVVTFFVVGLSLINSFWLIPILRSQQGVANLTSTNNLISLLDSLLLFQPHFPLNEFGRVTAAPFYYALLPLLILLGGFIKGSKFFNVFTVLFLLFVFLAKGESDPLGQIYTWVFDSIPFGVAFRDSTKFYIPLLLSASVLLSLSSEGLIKCLKGKLKEYSHLFYFIIVIFLLLLIHPAIFGGLSGALSSKQEYFKKKTENYYQLYNFLNKDKGFFRTVWFDEKPPLGFADWNHPSISANRLYQEKPFASMIEGNYDLYYFIHDPKLIDWFKLLGVKYAFFPENERKKIKSDKEVYNQKLFLDFTEDIAGFKKINSNIRAFQLEDPNPHIFSLSKIIAVAGDYSIYSYLEDNIPFDLSKNGFLFLEDGVLNADQLLSLPKSSYMVIKKDREDLADIVMPFLQKEFIDISNYSSNQWGLIQAGQFLDAKNELLKNGFKSFDTLFNRQLLYSTIKGEKYVSWIKPMQKGDYYLAVRFLSATDSSKLKLEFNNQENDLISDGQRFRWKLIGPLSLEKKPYQLIIENNGGFHAINILSLIKVSDYNVAITKANKIFSDSLEINPGNPGNLVKLNEELKSVNYQQINHSLVNPAEYIINPKDNTWIVFTEHYNKGWEIKGLSSSSSFPLYSNFNGFYVENIEGKNGFIYYKPQDTINLGLKISIVSLIMITVVTLPLYFWFKHKK